MTNSLKRAKKLMQLFRAKVKPARPNKGPRSLIKLEQKRRRRCTNQNAKNEKRLKKEVFQSLVQIQKTQHIKMLAKLSIIII